MHSLDSPISDYSKDKLNFKPFAKKIAKGILNYKQNKTFILSINGQWGSGKTSLMNLIKKELEKENKPKGTFMKIKSLVGFDNDKIKIMHFNPWLLTNIEQVISLFFNELKNILSNKNIITKALDDFEELLTPDTIKFQTPFAEMDYKIGNKKSIENIKKNISTILTKLDKKIIIIIDDIDRLTDKETEFIFRLTKGIADFDNLIYILLYDKRIVAQSLSTFKKEDGEKYLEKIVQYTISVPKPHNSTIQNLLTEKIDTLMKETQASTNQKYSTIYYQSLFKIIRRHILNVRDINIIMNIVSFEYPIIAEDVDFIDFFLISLIKIKNIELYEYIKISQKENYEDLINKYPNYKTILEFLLNEKNDGYGEKHLSHSYYFENYFSFSMPDDKITNKVFKDLEKCFLSDNIDEFKNKILSLKQPNNIIYTFVEMFYDISLKREKIKNNMAIPLLRDAILNGSKTQEEYKNAFNNIMIVLYKSVEYKDIKRNLSLGLLSDILRCIKENDIFLLTFYKENKTVPLFAKYLLYINTVNRGGY
jgi:uridine kinase